MVVRVLAGQSSSFLRQARLMPLIFPVKQLHTIFLWCLLAALWARLWQLLKTPSAEALVHEDSSESRIKRYTTLSPCLNCQGGPFEGLLILRDAIE